MIKPIPNYIIIAKSGRDAMESNLIHLLDNHEQMRGIVLAVHANDTTVKIGDDILFGKNSTKSLKIDDIGLLLLHQDNIMAIIEEK